MKRALAKLSPLMCERFTATATWEESAIRFPAIYVQDVASILIPWIFRRSLLTFEFGT